MWESVAGSEDDAIRAEHGVGRDMAAVIHEQAHRPADPDVQALLDDILQPLAGCVRNPVYRFHVAAVSGDHPTAFALPGGFIFVAPSLVELAERDRDELAFVVGHEMAHVIRRHAIDRLLSQKALSAISLATPGTRAIAPWMRTVGVQWLERAYSRDQELEADELGTKIMRAAGFDPNGAVRMLDRFRQFDHGSNVLGLGPYLSTHPPIDVRVAHVRQRLGLTG